MIDAYGLSIPETLEEICRSSRCAVIIYDMQVGIVPQIDEGQEVLLRCQELLDAARTKGLRVYFARHMFLPNRAAGIGQLQRSMIWQNQNDASKLLPLMSLGSESWRIVPELAPRPDEVIVDKITMSAFESTFLNIAMRDAGINAFIIAGIALEVGIEPTVRQGLDLNYIPVVVTDACGSKTPELKERSIATLSHTGEVRTVKTTDVIAAMS